MVRIPDAEIARLKREVPIRDLVESSGIELKRHGRNWIGHCPFHDDKTPSLVVTPSKNLWHCLGACSTGGSVLDWVMRREELPFRAAAEKLLERFPPSSNGSGHGAAPPRRSDPPIDLDRSTADTELLGQVIGYYHRTLLESPEALEYLKRRGIDSSEAIARFRLGYANRTLGLRLPEKNRKAGAAIRGRLQKLGIMRKSGHEHLNGSLVIPILNEAGQVVQAYGRKLTRGLRKGTEKHLYLPGPHRGVWNAEALVASKEVILCESLIDALTFWCAGFRQVTTAYGVNGVTEELIEAFQRHGTERVLIAFDRDEAGEAAAKALAERLAGDGVGCYRVLFPHGMDANEYALSVSPAEKSLDLVVRMAKWIPSAGRGEGEAPVREPEPEVTVLPSNPSPSLPVEVKRHEVAVELEGRRYRIRGLAKNLSYDVMKINLFVARTGDDAESHAEGFHVDNLDLYSARQRGAYIKQSALELGLEEEAIKRDLGKVLLELERLQDEQIKRTLEPESSAAKVELSSAEREAAMELLRDPKLLDRILEDFERSGVVGETTNKLVGYLAAVSRKLTRPLAVLLQSSSAAGKSALMDSVLGFVPEEERVQYSAMTGQSLFYMGEKDLRHKVLAIAEEEGAERASYALKLLQSEGELSIASTGKDPQSGRLVTEEYHVEGPVAILFTTTSIEIDEELLNRCLVLTVDEGREQTQAIHRMQRERETLEGQLRLQDRRAVCKLHRNAQRLLEPLLVVNPYASKLRFPDACTRTRRDHEKYLMLIRSIALLFQHQREQRHATRESGEEVTYIEVEPRDVQIANRLAHEVLGRTLDELPPQTRRLLLELHPLVQAECERLELDQVDFRFTRRWVREATGWGDTQLKVHLARLVDLEYLVVYRNGHGQRFLYELLYDGEGTEGRPFIPGLIDVDALFSEYDTNRSGQNGSRSGQKPDRSAPGRPLVGPRSGGGRSGDTPLKSETSAENPENLPEITSGVLERETHRSPRSELRELA